MRIAQRTGLFVAAASLVVAGLLSLVWPASANNTVAAGQSNVGSAGPRTQQALSPAACTIYQYAVTHDTWLYPNGQFVPRGSIFNVPDLGRNGMGFYYGNAYRNHDPGSWIGDGQIWASNLAYLRCW
jgi:hypothetical protein